LISKIYLKINAHIMAAHHAEVAIDYIKHCK
jgi:hypothetical protein